MSENFRLCLKVPVDGRYWLLSSFKFQLMCQVLRRGTFSETCLLLCTCSSTIVDGIVFAKSLATITHCQTCLLTDHRSSLYQRFCLSTIWRSEEFHGAPLRPFPAFFVTNEAFSLCIGYLPRRSPHKTYQTQNKSSSSPSVAA